MYYQESAIIAANAGFIEEDVVAVDDFLFQNQGNAVRVGRLSSFTDLDESTVENMLAKYVAAGVVNQASLALCTQDDVLIEEQDTAGNYVCDLCDGIFAEENLMFEDAYIPRETKFECGDKIPTAESGRAVDGVTPISGCSNSDRVADVVFVHGLDGDATSTWHPTGKPDDFFPKWLGEDFPNVGVWTLGYSASSSSWKGTTMPLVDRAGNMLAKLETAGIGQRPLIFIVHSLGGLLVKQAIRDALGNGNSHWEAIARKIKGIMFIATPHSGSNIPNYVKYLGKTYRSTVTLDELEIHHPALRNLNQWFQANCVKLGIAVEVLFEKEPTFGLMVVDETSANPGIAGVVPIAVDANHATICKPASKSSFVFGRAHLIVSRNT